MTKLLTHEVYVYYLIFIIFSRTCVVFDYIFKEKKYWKLSNIYIHKRVFTILIRINVYFETIVLKIPLMILQLNLVWIF